MNSAARRVLWRQSAAVKLMQQNTQHVIQLKSYTFRQWHCHCHKLPFSLKLRTWNKFKNAFIFVCLQFHFVCRNNAVGIATRYGLDGPKIESRLGGRDFLQPFRPALGPTQPLHNAHRVFPESKAAGAWRWPPTPSSAEVKEKVELYIFSTCGSSWPVVGWTVPLPLPVQRHVTTNFSTNWRPQTRSERHNVSHVTYGNAQQTEHNQVDLQCKAQFMHKTLRAATVGT